MLLSPRTIVADYLPPIIPATAFREALEAGAMPVVKIGGQTFISHASFLDWQHGEILRRHAMETFKSPEQLAEDRADEMANNLLGKGPAVRED